MLSISSDDVIECVAPKGWGYEYEDAGFKVGINTGILVTSDFIRSIDDIDTLIITESVLSLPNTDIAEKIESVLIKHKKVIVIRKVDVDFEHQLVEISHKNNNLELYMGNQTKLNTDIELSEANIEEVPAPIILVLGAGERCCKFDVQLELREALLKEGYTLSQIGSKNYCEFFGFHSFPDFMLNHYEYAESEKVIGFNKYIKSLYMHEKPDVIVIGVPGGVFPFDEYFHNDFGIINFYVFNAIAPDYIIFNALYVEALSEYLKAIKKQLYNKYGYKTDQVFISNFVLNYPVSRSDKVLAYLTCKTSSILEKTKGLGIYNIYDKQSKKKSLNKLINTMQKYADISLI